MCIVFHLCVQYLHSLYHFDNRLTGSDTQMRNVIKSDRRNPSGPGCKLNDRRNLEYSVLVLKKESEMMKDKTSRTG